MGNGEKKIQFIQMIRGLAALGVVIFHASFYVPSVKPSVQWLSSGVDIFFILSGFIMVYTTKNNDGSLLYVQKFWIKRLARIFPLYAILTLLYLLAMALTAVVIHRVDLVYTPTEIIKSIFFIPLILHGPGGPFWGGSILHTGWSLNFEVYFYILFGLSMLFRRYRWLFFFGFITVSLIIFPATKGHISFDSKYYYDWNLGYLNFMTSPLIWEFVIGVIIGLLYFSPFRIKSKQVCWLLCVLSVSFASWLLIGNFSHGFGPGISNYGFPYIFLFASLAISSKTIDFKVPYFLVWLGNISFSLYLMHPIIIHPFASIIYEYEPIRTSMLGVPFIVFITTLCIVSAAICYELLEKRISGWSRDKLIKERKLSIPLHDDSARMQF